MFSRYFLLIFYATTILTSVSSCFLEEKTEKKAPSTNALTYDYKGLSSDSFLLKTTKGNVVFKLYYKQSPVSSKRIKHLISQGFYDNLNFHRIVKNVLIQTGDPTSTGKGGSGKRLPLEISQDLSHIRGAIGIARVESDETSGDSQLYFLLKTSEHLDGKYTIVGQVIEGITILDGIDSSDRILSISIR